MTAEVREAAYQLAVNLQADISNATTRIEHIRLTQLAEEAARLLQAIDNLGKTE